MAGDRLKGQVAIVTGASRGLGQSIAVALAAEGAAVAVAARSKKVWNERLPGTIFETVELIEKAGGIGLPVPCDVSSGDELEALTETTRRELGPIGVLVNNAALTVPGRPPKDDSPKSTAPAGANRKPRVRSGSQGFLEFPVSGYLMHMRVGVLAAFRLMQLCLPDMIEAKRGSVINISSGASRHPPEGPYPNATGGGAFAYGGNKIALEHLTRAVAWEMSPHGIAVNCLLPAGAIMTPGVAAMNPEVKVNDSPENFAEAVVRLAAADPKQMNGWVAWHDEILNPELKRRGLADNFEY